MPYSPTTWVNDVTKVNADHMNNIEVGVDLAVDMAEGSPNVLYVTATGDNSDDGQSWATAKLTIQAAVDAVSATGGVVFVGPGTYDPFTVASTSTAHRTEIRGVGEAKVLATGASAIAITVSGYGIVGPLIENLLVEGSGEASTQTGIRLAGAGRVTIRRCRIANCLVGIDFYNDAGLFTERNHIEDTLVNDCGTGIRFFRTATGHSSFSYNHLTNVGVDSCPTVGINLGGGGGAVPNLYSCVFDDVVVWAQDDSAVAWRIACNMTGVRGHITAERIAGATTTGYDVTANASGMTASFLNAAFVGTFATPVALAAGTFLTVMPRRDDHRLLAEGQGYIGETFPRTLAQGNSVMTDGTIAATLIPLRRGDLVTNIIVGVTTNAAVATLVKVALYSKTGSRLAVSADVDTDFNAGTTPRGVIVPLTTPYAVQDDDVFYLAFLAVGGTPPQLLKGVNLAGHNFAVGSGVRPAAQIAAGGQTDMPSSGSINALSNPPWFGWS